MRQLLPVADDVDPAVAYAGDDRPAPDGRPWVMINMISSIDGASALDGRSGGLGSPADKEVFRAIRSVADVILVGAGTVRDERYGQPRPSPARQEERRSRGQQPVPRLVVLSRRLEFGPASRLFTEPGPRPLVLTTSDSDPQRRAALSDVAEVVEAGERSVEPRDALRLLRDRGAGVVLAEGGPTLNGQLIAAGLVDEVCLSLSALVVAGSSDRIAHHHRVSPIQRMRLDRLLWADEILFLRYVRSVGS